MTFFMRSSILIALAVCAVVFATSQGSSAERLFPIIADRDAWKHLPAAADGQGELLPVWAGMLAPSLPSTTAAMLEMDRVQRTESTLEPKLRAKIRWAAAKANGCAYSQAYARADLLSAGGQDAELNAIATDIKTLPAAEQRVYRFARLMCHAAYEVTDDDVRLLLDDHGAENLTAIVLLLAYASFQDRLFNAIEADVERDGPLPPPTARFDWPKLQRRPRRRIERIVPDRPNRDEPVATHVDDPAWKVAPLESLRTQLAQQQHREPRIPIPPADVVERNMPPGLYPPGQSTAIRWNSVTFGYQPKLSAAWIFTMRQFREDAALPDDFRQSVFWVVTRSNQCYY